MFAIDTGKVEIQQIVNSAGSETEKIAITVRNSRHAGRNP
ncbi:hypothetical protein JOD54_006227 [Actinokineospora baliensis]|nr:hypothetical protein [Actinokineospora baliensis]